MPSVSFDVTVGTDEGPMVPYGFDEDAFGSSDPSPMSVGGRVAVIESFTAGPGTPGTEMFVRDGFLDGRYTTLTIETASGDVVLDLTDPDDVFLDEFESWFWWLTPSWGAADVGQVRTVTFSGPDGNPALFRHPLRAINGSTVSPGDEFSFNDPIYADPDFTATLPNPITADSAGRLPAIYGTDGTPVTMEGQPKDDAGNALPLATLTFYQERTTELAVIYSDEELQTPATNPQTADADGEFDPIYLDALNYRVVLRDQHGRLIYDVAYRIEASDEVDSTVIMSATSIRARTSDANVSLQTCNGHDASGGEVAYDGLPFKALIVGVSRTSAANGGSNLSVRIHGEDQGGGSITEDITLGPSDMWKLGTTDFYVVTGITLLVAPLGGGDAAYSVGTRRVTTQGNSGFEQVSFRGAVAVRLNATVSGTEKVLDGPYAPFTNTGATGELWRIDFAAMDLEDVVFMVDRISNPASRDFTFDGTPSNDVLVLSANHVDGAVNGFTSLENLKVTAGSSTAPFVDVGISYRGPEL